MTSRIDIIGQNGPTGEHYKVEKVARMIAKEWHSGGLDEFWEDFVPLAIKIVEVIEDE